MAASNEEATVLIKPEGRIAKSERDPKTEFRGRRIVTRTFDFGFLSGLGFRRSDLDNGFVS